MYINSTRWSLCQLRNKTNGNRCTNAIIWRFDTHSKGGVRNALHKHDYCLIRPLSGRFHWAYPSEIKRLLSQKEILTKSSESYSNVVMKAAKTSMKILISRIWFRAYQWVFTTFFNLAENPFRSHFAPDWIIGDELGPTREAGILIPVCSNLESIERILRVGDAQQLAPVVKTHNRLLSNGTVVNEFADLQVQSLILRLQRASLRHQCCFRWIAGLEQPSSKLFYENKVVNESGISLHEQFRSQNIVKFPEFEFGIQKNRSPKVPDKQKRIAYRHLEFIILHFQFSFFYLTCFSEPRSIVSRECW